MNKFMKELFSLLGPVLNGVLLTVHGGGPGITSFSCMTVPLTVNSPNSGSPTVAQRCRFPYQGILMAIITTRA